MASLFDETRLLTRLVDDLRELALAEAGQLRLEHEPVDLASLAQGVVGNFSPGAEAAGVKLACAISGEGLEVTGDADRLGQVLRNLISNALRHTPAGGRVTVSVGRSGERVLLEVADTGTGISPEDLPHVFDRFYRGDKSRSRRGGGAGLGLAIARQLVIAHGGEIAAESTLGAGTTFRVTLPAAVRGDNGRVGEQGAGVTRRRVPMHLVTLSPLHPLSRSPIHGFTHFAHKSPMSCPETSSARRRNSSGVAIFHEYSA